MTPAPLPRPEELPSIEELVRVLDVAGEVRRKEEVLRQLWDRNSARDELRTTLAETARLSGDPLSEAEADAAVEWYYDRLHRFEPPPSTLSTRLWTIYVRRGRWLAIAAIVLAALIAAGVLLWPDGAAGPTPEELDETVTAVDELAGDDPRVDVDAWREDARRYAAEGNTAALSRLLKQAEGVRDKLNEAFRIRIIGVWPSAAPGGPWLPYPRSGGPSLDVAILEAVDAAGEPTEVEVFDVTSQQAVRVSRWGQVIPSPVYARLLADPQALEQSPTFAVKRRGELDWDVKLLGRDGQPVAVGLQYVDVRSADDPRASDPPPTKREGGR